MLRKKTNCRTIFYVSIYPKWIFYWPRKKFVKLRPIKLSNIMFLQLDIDNCCAEGVFFLSLFSFSQSFTEMKPEKLLCRSWIKTFLFVTYFRISGLSFRLGDVYFRDGDFICVLWSITELCFNFFSIFLCLFGSFIKVCLAFHFVLNVYPVEFWVKFFYSSFTLISDLLSRRISLRTLISHQAELLWWKKDQFWWMLRIENGEDSEELAF